MKRKTYNNVLKAIKMIQKKGYDFDEASTMALKVFDDHAGGEMPIEFYIDKIIPKNKFLELYKNNGGNNNDK